MKVKRHHICILIIAFGVGLLNSACTRKHTTAGSNSSGMIDSLIPKYSHSFRVDYYDGYRVVKVFSGKDKKTTTTYLLCSKGAENHNMDDAVKVNYPATRIVCMSTTHVGAMKLLDARSLIVAAANVDLICDSSISAMIRSGAIKSASKDYQPDYEVIAAVKPDLLFSDGENSGSSQMYAKMKALGEKIVSSRDYFEQEPLARAEWIKFFAAFTGKEKLADSIFAVVEKDYLVQVKQIAAKTDRPSVFCNLPYSGVWYMPCGENYVAKLIKDAGGMFLWSNEKAMNGLNLTLNFEQVYQRAANADLWINTGTFSELKQISDVDAKFKLFKAFKTGKVYNSTNRLSSGGGMDIWETGTYTPNVVLRDLALIFHSRDNIQDKLYYYRQLK